MGFVQIRITVSSRALPPPGTTQGLKCIVARERGAAGASPGGGPAVGGRWDPQLTTDSPAPRVSKVLKEPALAPRRCCPARCRWPGTCSAFSHAGGRTRKQPPTPPAPRLAALPLRERTHAAAIPTAEAKDAPGSLRHGPARARALEHPKTHPGGVANPPPTGRGWGEEGAELGRAHVFFSIQKSATLHPPSIFGARCGWLGAQGSDGGGLGGSRGGQVRALAGG